METATTNTGLYTVKQDYKYMGDEYWAWWIWIDAAAPELDKIEHVTYILHPTFSNPIQDVKDRSNNFLFKTAGWGTFTIPVKIHLKNGEELQLEHELVLEYPDEGWQLLSEINIKTRSDERTIQLLHGDLTAIPKKHATDILVVSAYPGSYEPVQLTVISALKDKGISVADMAADKDIDLREQLNCWLSKPLNAEQQEQFNFKRILCFEPPVRNDISVSVVGNIFRCINTFAFDIDNKVICLPLLASGSRGIPLSVIVPAILDASIFWLEKEIPLQYIKLVVYTDDEAEKTAAIFNTAKHQYELKNWIKKGEISGTEAIDVINKELNLQANTEYMPIVESEIKQMAGVEPVTRSSTLKATDRECAYDFYISYAKAQAAAVKIFVEALLAINPSLKIFYDNTSLQQGSLWIKNMSDVIQDSENFICIFSPEYNTSDYCWDEFQFAKTIEYRIAKPFIKVINFKKDPNQPAIMSMYSYIDCTEENIEKLKDAAKYLVYKR